MNSRTSTLSIKPAAASIAAAVISTTSFPSSIATAVLTAAAAVSIPGASARPQAKPPQQAARGPVKQIYTMSNRQELSVRLGAYGVPAYIVTARGTNRGFYISSISGRGVASQAGLTDGDVLLQLNNRVVQTARDADRILSEIPSGQLRIVFARQGESYLNCYNPVIAYTNELQSGAGVLTSQGADGSLSASSSRALAANSKPFPIATLERYMLELVNADRKANGLEAISMSSSLSNVARAHAEDMVKRRFFDHVNPDGVNPMGRAQAAGINAPVAENIATKSALTSPTEMVKGCQQMMMNEPPNQPNHRGNILGPRWVCVGIGVAQTKGGGVMCVQEFSSSALP